MFVDPVTHKELGRHRFQSVRRVKTDKTSTLVGTTVAEPTKIVTAGGLAKDKKSPFDEHINIRCVAYSDGTTWNSPTAAPDDCARLKKPKR